MKARLLALITLLSMALVIPSDIARVHAVVTGAYFDTIVTVLMENTGINASDNYCSGSNHCYVLGNSNAPHMNNLYNNLASNKAAFAASYTAVGHPSSPNYEALLAGQVTSQYNNDQSSSYQSSAANLIDSLQTAGVTWQAYAESASNSGLCSFSPPRGAAHFPFIMFSSNNVAARCANFHSATSGSDTELITSLNASTPANFYWMTPTDNNNCHDDPLSTGSSCDTYIGNLISSITSSTAFTGTRRSVLFVTFDEAGAGCTSSPCTGSTNDYVYTVMIGSSAYAGHIAGTRYNHYSWLSTVEANWGLPCLSNDCSATKMTDLFQPTFDLSPTSFSVILCDGCSAGLTYTLTSVNLQGTATYNANVPSGTATFTPPSGTANLPLSGQLRVNMSMTVTICSQGSHATVTFTVNSIVQQGTVRINCSIKPPH